MLVLAWHVEECYFSDLYELSQSSYAEIDWVTGAIYDQIPYGIECDLLCRR